MLRRLPSTIRTAMPVKTLPLCQKPEMPRLALGVISLLMSAASSAAVFIVDSAEDSGKGSLRQALLNANAAAGPHTISIEVPGTGVVLSLASPLPPISAGELSISALASPGFSIDGGNLHRIFEATNGSTQVSLSDLRLLRGRATSGGCVLGRNALGFSLRLERMRFEDCSAQNGAGLAAGGAVQSFGQSLEVIDSRFLRNSAVGQSSRGGAINSDAVSLDLRDSRFEDNSAGISSGSLTREGGAIALVGSRVDVAFVRGARFTGNTAGSGTGASGGGLLVSCETCSVQLEANYFGANTAGTGGAVRVLQGFSGGNGVELRIVNSSFERNVASASGGALQLSNTLLDMRHVSLQRNRAANGAHLATSTAFELSRLSNALFAAIDSSLGTTACQLLAAPAAPGPRSGNLFADISCGALSASGSTSLPIGTLGVLDVADDALPVLVFDAGSAVIDGGASAGCLTDDARGNERPIDGNGDGDAVCDPGAFEHADLRIFSNGFEAGLR
jgi:hypothetical protein